MPAKNKKKQKRKQLSQTSSENNSVHAEEQEQLQNVDINTNDQSKIEISSAQAELYFEYLRKKISHQANDPFSLPFLNLKFQQLQSWKGATEQLNLQSRIYGMRVDNCHDYTMKMLNFVIRNQEDQISKPSKKNTQQKNTDIRMQNHQSQSQANFNFNLQKPEKLICNIEVDKNLSNHSLWKVIFKKSETLQKIQLNTLQLSDKLSLEIDERNIKWCKKQNIEDSEQENDKIMQKKQNEDPLVNNTLKSYKISIDKLSIFDEISNTKGQIFKEIEEILQQKHELENKLQRIQQSLFNQTFFGFQSVDFDGMYQEYNQFTKYQQHAKSAKNSQKTDFNFEEEENREQIFEPIRDKELFQIPIDHINMLNSQIQQFQHESEDDAEEHGDLYEPHKDILFHSTLKKPKGSKRIQNKKHGKRVKTHQTLIDFYDTSIIANRKNVFNERKEIKNNIQNDNLVPINYVVLYENRNPFKKNKKITKFANRVSFYDNFHNHPLMDFDLQNTKDKKSIQKPSMSQIFQQENFFNSQINPFNQQNENTEQNLLTQRHYKNVSMKTVKNEIMKEISCIEETSKQLQFQKTRRLSNISLMSETSVMDSYLEEEGQRIGLKFLKSKMTSFDPLDILMSMLHVAYENQVLLQPVYQSQSNQKFSGVKLQDIVIQGSSFW